MGASWEGAGGLAVLGRGMRDILGVVKAGMGQKAHNPCLTGSPSANERKKKQQGHRTRFEGHKMGVIFEQVHKLGR